MDDIRRPQHLKRRDYAIPAGRPDNPARHTRHHTDQFQPQPSSPARPPHHHAPQPQADYSQSGTMAAPQHYRHSPSPAAQHYQPAHPQPPHATAADHIIHRKKLLGGKKLSLVIAIIVAALAIFGSGYLLKGSNDAKGIPASITRQVNYDLYFPSPMPAGYVYMKDTATFQIGQVFYKFANGKKRVTVNEQPMPSPKPNLAKLPGYTQFNSSAGPAAIGKDLGEPTAVILTPTTVITMHCVGGVSQNDLKTAIMNLKNIGQNNQKT